MRLSYDIAHNCIPDKTSTVLSKVTRQFALLHKKCLTSDYFMVVVLVVILY